MNRGISDMSTDERLHERRRERIAAGRTAWAALQKHEHFGQWLAVADALVAIREEAMEQACTNRPQGPPYRAAFKAIVEQKETWAVAIDDTVRAHCYWLVDNLPAVQRWREGLSFKQRDEWNHPSTVKRRYDRLTSVKKQEEAQQRQAAARAQPVDAMEIIRQLRGGVFSPGTSMEEVASTLHASVSYDAFKRLVAACLRLMEPEDRQDRIEAQVRERTARNAKAKDRRERAKSGHAHRQ
jgi:hypothetical protein